LVRSPANRPCDISALKMSRHFQKNSFARN
jgi:hypothetical protein